LSRLLTVLLCRTLLVGGLVSILVARIVRRVRPMLVPPPEASAEGDLYLTVRRWADEVRELGRAFQL